MLFGEHRRKVRRGKVRLPQGFSAGPVGKRREERWCLFIIPQGEERILVLSEEERKYAEIKDEDEVVIAGCGSYFEVWNPHRFEQKIRESSKVFERVLEHLILQEKG